MSQAKIYLRAALRMKPFTCLDAARQPGVLMLLHDITGLLVCELTVYWMGDDALKFLNTHRAALVPGRCVDVQLSALHIAQRGGRPELTALVHSCVLAPLAVNHKNPVSINHEAQPA